MPGEKLGGVTIQQVVADVEAHKVAEHNAGLVRNGQLDPTKRVVPNCFSNYLGLSGHLDNGLVKSLRYYHLVILGQS